MNNMDQQSNSDVRCRRRDKKLAVIKGDGLLEMKCTRCSWRCMIYLKVEKAYIICNGDGIKDPLPPYN